MKVLRKVKLDKILIRMEGKEIVPVGMVVSRDSKGNIICSVKRCTVTAT